MKAGNRVTLALSLTALAAVHANAGAPSVDVIATGLNNPRGLGFAANGDLYVAEAGIGGSGKCRPAPDGQPVEVCYGETGALTRIDLGYMALCKLGLSLLGLAQARRVSRTVVPE
jgi:hypothetical protein